jgi:hypothetical protein
MATAPSYVEQQAIAREKSLIENLMDFSFERMVTPRILKMLRDYRLPELHLQRAAGVDHWLRGHASLDRVLPHCRGIVGRGFSRRPGHHEFAGLGW